MGISRKISDALGANEIADIDDLLHIVLKEGYYLDYNPWVKTCYEHDRYGTRNMFSHNIVETDSIKEGYAHSFYALYKGFTLDKQTKTQRIKLAPVNSHYGLMPWRDGHITLTFLIQIDETLIGEYTIYTPGKPVLNNINLKLEPEE